MLRDSTIRFIITDSKGIEQIEWGMNLIRSDFDPIRMQNNSNNRFCFLLALLFDQNGRIRSVTHRISKDSRLVITEIMQPHLDIKLSDRDFIKLIRQNYSNQFREVVYSLSLSLAYLKSFSLSNNKIGYRFWSHPYHWKITIDINHRSMVPSKRNISISG